MHAALMAQSATTLQAEVRMRPSPTRGWWWSAGCAEDGRQIHVDQRGGLWNDAAANRHGVPARDDGVEYR